MCDSKPDIPKKMAARIRAAQKAVQEIRDDLVHSHKRRLQAQSELDAYHRGARAYATERYGKSDGDSKPARIRISRMTEEVEYRTRRIERLQKDLPVAEEALEAEESAILAQVGSMRMTKGRVAWPSPLSSFDGRVSRGLRAQQREIDTEPSRIASYRARVKADYDREIAQNQSQHDREIEAERRRIASLPEDQREAERAVNRLFLDVLTERGLSPKDLFNGLSVSEIFDDIDREVKERLRRSKPR